MKASSSPQAKAEPGFQSGAGSLRITPDPCQYKGGGLDNEITFFKFDVGICAFLQNENHHLSYRSITAVISEIALPQLLPHNFPKILSKLLLRQVKTPPP